MDPIYECKFKPCPFSLLSRYCMFNTNFIFIIFTIFYPKYFSTVFNNLRLYVLFYSHSFIHSVVIAFFVYSSKIPEVPKNKKKTYDNAIISLICN